MTLLQAPAANKHEIDVMLCPPDNVVKNSSIRGNRYISVLACLLTVCLKSPQIRIEPSFLTIGTMGVAHYENLAGVIIPSACNLSNSAVTLSHRANGTCRALRKRGLEFSFK